jgi:stage III sporulation protein AE
VRQGITVLFSQLLIDCMDQFLIPMVYSYVVISCACAAVGNTGLDKLAGLIKSGATFLLTSILLVFVGYLTASGAIAGSVDASAVKAAKLAISRAVPVVGGILADASETVLAGAGTLKSSVGAAGMLVILAICLIPFLRLAIHYLMYKVTAALCATIAQPRLSKLIDGIGGAFGLVLGMTGAAGLVLMISLVSALKVVIP